MEQVGAPWAKDQQDSLEEESSEIPSFAQGCPGQERGVCEKSYKEKIHLKRHETLHFQRKPFKCRKCFLQTWELTMHQRTHTAPGIPSHRPHCARRCADAEQKDPQS
ncbi:zinc finger protein 319-like [Mauremys reevesii]|uniref:zinc finger protein 319-like n=1 Tax=Mauremys reevesii TaxID=260615 RepID=UPI00193FB123|nr:zinc finger protein 319-like [Mauremys reevesii]